MLQLFDSIRKRKARIAVMIVAHLSAVFWEGYGCPNGKGRGDRRGNLYTG